mmetsp:Transcript_81171/g.210872  ORF Transcript_81171/g.210872 Transcript_81171/m.210872 type:complete len:228 (-) Transcript_81171:2224-2907(-)
MRRRAKADTPGATAGRRPEATGPRRWRSLKTFNTSAPRAPALASSPACSDDREDEDVESPCMEEPSWTSCAMRRSRSKDSLSSRERIRVSVRAKLGEPSMKESCPLNGIARGPRDLSSCTRAARESASMAATASSIRTSCRKLPCGEKRTATMSRDAVSSTAGTCSSPSATMVLLSLDTTSAAASVLPTGAPASTASSRLPFITFVKLPKPLAKSSMRFTLMRRPSL